jgi:hypothetical protein
MNKYAALSKRLQTERDGSFSIDFPELERLLGFALPRSARAYRAWWANDARGHSHARSWLEFGWRVSEVDLVSSHVRFERSDVINDQEKSSGDAGIASWRSQPSPDSVPKPVQRSFPNSRASQVGLISCVKQKAPSACAAKDLYTSPLFKKSRAVVEAAALPWFILSARYGLVHPDDVIEPYDETLNGMRRDRRETWAKQVGHAIETRLPRTSEILIFAGERYSEHLLPLLEQAGYRVLQPLKGLGLGERLSYLDAMRRGL